MQLTSINNIIEKFLSRDTVIIIIAVSVFCHTPLVSGQTADEYLADLFSPAELIKFGIVTPPQYAQLTKLDKHNLIKAKAVLVEFLKSINQRNSDPLDYIHPKIRKNYKDRYALLQQEFGNAEALVEIKIFNFLLKGEHKDEIVFYAALTDTMEGVDRSYQTAFALTKYGDTWKISRFRPDIKNWQHEIKN